MINTATRSIATKSIAMRGIIIVSITRNTIIKIKIDIIIGIIINNIINLTLINIESLRRGITTRTLLRTVIIVVTKLISLIIS